MNKPLNTNEISAMNAEAGETVAVKAEAVELKTKSKKAQQAQQPEAELTVEQPEAELTVEQHEPELTVEQHEQVNTPSIEEKKAEVQEFINSLPDSEYEFVESIVKKYLDSLPEYYVDDFFEPYLEKISDPAAICFFTNRSRQFCDEDFESAFKELSEQHKLRTDKLYALTCQREDIERALAAAKDAKDFDKYVEQNEKLIAINNQINSMSARVQPIQPNGGTKLEQKTYKVGNETIKWTGKGSVPVALMTYLERLGYDNSIKTPENRARKWSLLQEIEVE